MVWNGASSAHAIITAGASAAVCGRRSGRQQQRPVPAIRTQAQQLQQAENNK